MDSLLVTFIVWVLGFGLLGTLVKRRVALFFIRKIKLFQFVNFLIIATPFILVEEAITCETAYMSCIQTTFPSLLFHISIFYIFLKFSRLSEFWNVFIYGLWGSIGEFIINGKLLPAIALGVPTLTILLVLNTLIYMTLIIVPNYYVLLNKKMVETT